MMLCDPEPLIPPFFRVCGKIAGIVQCFACIGAFGHADQIEDR